VPPTEQLELDRRGIAALGFGHFAADLGQGAIPALLPFLIAVHGWSIGAASALVLAVSVSSSIVQPLFGHVSDRVELAWLMPAGLALAGIGIGLVGVAPSYPTALLATVAGGLGIAAFHPEGSRFANYVSGARRATGMSLFSVGGNAGFAAGPILVTPLVLLLGLNGTLGLAAIPLAAAVLLAREQARLARFRPTPTMEHRAAQTRAPDAWAPFTRLSLAVIARSIVYFGLMTFVPLHFVTHLHTSKATANAALAVMLVAGAVGTLVGGRLADRIGRRAVFRGSMAGLIPLLAVLPFAGPALAIVLLAAIGALTIATFSITVVMGQELLPGRIGIASGVTLGLGIGIGGLSAAALGVLADHAGVETVLHLLVLLPPIALALALSLPERGVKAPPAPRRTRRRASSQPSVGPAAS
jgi:FSR family fosmidomycin resistance protein-like MFS transporter